MKSVSDYSLNTTKRNSEDGQQSDDEDPDKVARDISKLSIREQKKKFDKDLDELEENLKH